MFELISKMYADINLKLEEISEKTDKVDIVGIEDKLDSNSKALFDG